MGIGVMGKLFNLRPDAARLTTEYSYQAADHVAISFSTPEIIGSGSL